MNTDYITDEYRERMRQRSLELWNDPEYRRKVKEGCQRLWANPKHREKQAVISKAQWADPAYRETQRAARANSKAFGTQRAEAIRAKAKERWADPEFVKRMRAVMTERYATKPAKCSLPCVIDGVSYISRVAAMRALGVSRKTVEALIAAQEPQS